MLRCELADRPPAPVVCDCHPEGRPIQSGRRGFLRGVAALGSIAAVVGRGSSAAAQDTGTPFRIDVHHHYTSPALLAMMKGRRTNQTFNENWSLAKSLDAMEQGGVATAVVSTSDPGVFFGDYNAARALARDCNDYQARMVADHPGRFGMFTTVPLPDPDLALAEIAYGLDTLKAHGVGLMTSYGGKYLGDPAFAPVMEELNRRKAVVFVHPLMTSCCTGLVPGVPEVVVEYQSETSRTIASLVFSGTTLRFPDIRFIFSHGGGTVPYLVARFDRLFSGRADLMQMMPDGAVGALRKLYFDTAQAYNPYSMASLTRLMPSDHIVFGSDFPAASPHLTADGLAAFGLMPEALRAINRDNALGLMPALAG